MEEENVLGDLQQDFPVLFIPKQCTKLEMSCEMSDNVFIALSINSPDMEGNEICIYTGFCNVKLVESCNISVSDSDQVETEVDDSNSSIDCDINKMPVILSDANIWPSQPENVWIDPSRSPYVYNHYDTAQQPCSVLGGFKQPYSVLDAGCKQPYSVLDGGCKQSYSVLDGGCKQPFSVLDGGCKQPCSEGGGITIQQHNTYITQNVYNYDNQMQKNELDFNDCENEKSLRDLTDSSYEDDHSESDMFLSELSKANKKIDNTEVMSKVSSKAENNDALKQLMSSTIQSTSKQRKTIMFLGEDSSTGQTIQNIHYTDPAVKCSALAADHEIVIDEIQAPTPHKKKYQCDKCKQIFHQLSEFRQHMVGNHTNYKVLKDKGFSCPECGKHFSNNFKYRNHCLGHGDPERECSKCFKIFSSKHTLKNHAKIHERKFPCQYCSKSYAMAETYKRHLKKHFNFVCDKEGCFFITDSDAKRDDHEYDHIEFCVDQINQGLKQSEVEGSFMDDLDEDFEHDLITTEDDLKMEFSELEKHDKGDLEKNEHSDIDISEDMVENNLKKKNFEDNKVKEKDKIQMEQDERVKMADSVIAKVMSNKVFLLNSKTAKKQVRGHKTCQACSKSFDRISDLKRHLIEHIVKSTLAKSVNSRQGILKLNCEICQTASFNSLDKYKAHLREHAKLTLYKCTFCDKSFSDSSNFSKHKKVHGISYYQCDLCHRKFNSKLMIAKHIEVHAKNKPVECKICRRVFHFKSMLNKHVKTLHTKPVSVKFPCRFCTESFKSLKEKWDHEWVVHSIRKMVYDCLVCDAKFRKFSELKRHCSDEHAVEIPTQKKLLQKSV